MVTNVTVEMAVTANFAADTFTLTVNNGLGSGSYNVRQPDPVEIDLVAFLPGSVSKSLLGSIV